MSSSESRFRAAQPHELTVIADLLQSGHGQRRKLRLHLVASPCCPNLGSELSGLHGPRKADGSGHVPKVWNNCEPDAQENILQQFRDAFTYQNRYLSHDEVW